MGYFIGIVFGSIIITVLARFSISEPILAGFLGGLAFTLGLIVDNACERFILEKMAVQGGG